MHFYKIISGLPHSGHPEQMEEDHQNPDIQDSPMNKYV